jgi:hypothetical protein
MENSFQLSTLEIQALENMLSNSEPIGDSSKLDESYDMSCTRCTGSCSGDCQGGCSGDCSGTSK